ncbi:hypothetical protein KEM52_002932 [Ascosphaera acerosa]|nr:hypothetical protein KEM52_002932 [Ascosphaera acerosa]
MSSWLTARTPTTSLPTATRAASSPPSEAKEKKMLLCTKIWASGASVGLSGAISPRATSTAPRAAASL